MMMFKRSKHQIWMLILEESSYVVVCRNQRVIALCWNSELGDSDRFVSIKFDIYFFLFVFFSQGVWCACNSIEENVTVGQASSLALRRKFDQAWSGLETYLWKLQGTHLHMKS